jgi:hypothetical protein
LGLGVWGLTRRLGDTEGTEEDRDVLKRNLNQVFLFSVISVAL